MHNIHDINHDIIKIYLYLTHITYSPWEGMNITLKLGTLGSFDCENSQFLC